MLVRATDMSMKLRVGISELHRIASPGEEFQVSSIRYKILSGNNKYNAVFVIPAKELKAEENKPKKKNKKKEVIDDASGSEENN